MNKYDFFLTDSLEKVLPVRRPRPLAEGKVIPVFPGTIPAVQLVYARLRGEKRGSSYPFTLSVEGAPVKPELRSVELTPVDFPSNEKTDEGYITHDPALLPDLLSPLREDKIFPQPDQYNAVWIDFPGIMAAQKGRYDIKIIAKADDKVVSGNGDEYSDPEAAGYRAELKLTLEVLGEALPPQALLHTQWFHTDCLASYYGVEVFSEVHWRIIEAFMAPMALRYGINTLLTPVFTPPLDTAFRTERPTVQLVDIEIKGDTYRFDFSKLERWCGLCKKHGITHIEIAHFFSQWGARSTPKIIAKENGVEKKIFGWDVPSGSPKYRKFLEQFIPALRKECEKYGYDKDHTIFHISDEPHGQAQIANYKTGKAQIADLVEGSLLLDALSDFSFYKEGILEHPVPANDAITPFLEAKIPGLWVYYCVSQSYRVPNRFIALPSPRCRAMGVLMYRYNIAGFLHWGYNYYYSALSKSLINPFLKTGGLKDWPAGDPFLVYPGADGKPLSSIRGEVHRESLYDVPTKYCGGCGHGVIHRIITELIDEMGLREKAIITNPVGCAIWADLYFDFDSVQPPHGRTPAAATGVKRILPDHLVICYQGDGDMAAIGTAEMIHAANRGEKFTTIFVNNAIYGMTGGQMAPTTLIGQKAATAPEGRDPVEAGMGYPIRVSEMLATLDGTRYIARGAVNNAANTRKVKSYIKKAFEAQMKGVGFTMVEVLSQCPTNWGMDPVDSVEWLEKNMIPVFPLGEIKNTLDSADKSANGAAK